MSDTAADRAVLKSRLVGTTINPETFLATDYLNHFNEVLMLVEMLPDVPDCLPDVLGWAPKGYEAHFRDSVFRERDLAIEAYRLSPVEVREPFDSIVDMLHALITGTLPQFQVAVEAGDTDRLSVDVSVLLADARHLLDQASALIHGRPVTMDQAAIDAAFDD